MSADGARADVTVGQVMSTELRTVAPDERLDLAALVMEEGGVRQLLVVEDGRRLVGLVSYRDLLRLMTAHRTGEIEAGGLVQEFMDPDPVTMTPDAALGDAVRIMITREVTAVPVVEDDRVVGILSEHDVVRVAGELLGDTGHDPDGR